jgi:hypothetical protein
MGYCDLICHVCGKKYVAGNVSKWCSDECMRKVRPTVKQLEKRKEYRRKYGEYPYVKDKAKIRMKERRVSIDVAGRRFWVSCGKKPKDAKKIIYELKNKVYDDCIKNPRKYLTEEK